MNNYLQITASDRLAKFAECLTLSAKHLYEAALIYGAMVDQGDDVSTIPYHLRLALQKINSGSMLPETYSTFPGRLRTVIGVLPVDKQRELAKEGAEVPLLLKKDALEPAMRRVLSLTSDEISQVFYKGTIRTPEEQSHFLLKKEMAVKKAKPAVLVRDGGAEINGKWLSKDDLIKILGKI